LGSGVQKSIITSASWDAASALARELDSQRRGFGDAIYSAARYHGAPDPLNDPDYLEAVRISNGINAISRRGRGGIDGYGILQELNPEFLPDNAEIIVSGGYIPKIDEIIERLHDLKSQMNALKAKYGISVPQGTN